VPGRASLLAVCCALLATLAGPARAQEVPEPAVIRVLADAHVVEIAGGLVGATAEKLREVLARVPDVRTVRLDSAGGILAVGIEVQAAIATHGLETEVLGTCNSACTVAFLGGKVRHAFVGARFGFHRASGEGENLSVADLIVRGLYLHAGVAEAFVDRVLATPHAEMWFPSLTELREAGFVSRPALAPALAR
jgi:hypothetical protein